MFRRLRPRVHNGEGDRTPGGVYFPTAIRGNADTVVKLSPCKKSIKSQEQRNSGCEEAKMKAILSVLGECDQNRLSTKWGVV
jgi:hypothetical protein